MTSLDGSQGPAVERIPGKGAEEMTDWRIQSGRSNALPSGDRSPLGSGSDWNLCYAVGERCVKELLARYTS